MDGLKVRGGCRRRSPNYTRPAVRSTANNDGPSPDHGTPDDHGTARANLAGSVHAACADGDVRCWCILRDDDQRGQCNQNIFLRLVLLKSRSDGALYGRLSAAKRRYSPATILAMSHQAPMLMIEW